MTSARISDRIFFRIGDVAEIAGIKPHVLRYWESEFSEIAPQKSGTGQRVYRRRDVETVLLIKKLLYTEKYSIEGARNRLRELRKIGELATQCREAADPLPASERDAREHALGAARKLLVEIEELNQKALRDVFKLYS
jgi:DNA-binding transcriptional MerR regulator